MTTLTVVKTADETRTSNTALADDELVLTLAANTTYRIRGQVVYCAAAAADLKVGLSGGSDITGAAGIILGTRPIQALNLSTENEDRSAVLVLSDIQTGLAKPFEGIGTSSTYTDYTTTLPINAVVTTGGDGATLEVVWAQNTTSATDPARVLAGSCLIAEPIPASSKRQIVIKQTDEGRSDPTADFAEDAALNGLTLAANTRYWVELAVPCYTKSSFATRILGQLCTDAVVVDRCMRSIRHTVASLASVSIQPSLSQTHGAASSELLCSWSVFNNIGNNTAFRGMMYCCGLVETGGTGGELWFEWRKTNNGGEVGPDVTVFADAYLIVEAMNPCSFSPT